MAKTAGYVKIALALGGLFALGLAAGEVGSLAMDALHKPPAPSKVAVAPLAAQPVYSPQQIVQDFAVLYREIRTNSLPCEQEQIRGAAAVTANRFSEYRVQASVGHNACDTAAISTLRVTVPDSLKNNQPLIQAIRELSFSQTFSSSMFENFAKNDLVNGQADAQQAYSQHQLSDDDFQQAIHLTKADPTDMLKAISDVNDSLPFK